MANNIDIYKFSEVIFTVNTLAIEDMPEDGEITIEYDRDRVTKLKDVGVGGIYGWRHGKPARVTIQILPNSQWVAALQNARNLGIPVAIGIEDRNEYESKAKFVCSKAMIQDGQVSFTADPTPVTFIFECMQLDDLYANVDLLPVNNI